MRKISLLLGASLLVFSLTQVPDVFAQKDEKGDDKGGKDDDKDDKGGKDDDKDDKGGKDDDGKGDEGAAKAAKPTYPEIVPTNIEQFDSVFSKVKDIHTTLSTEEASLKAARGNAKIAMGVAKGEMLATALASLKTNAAGKLKVVMSGTMPKLQASSVVPENVQAGLDAVNLLVDAAAHAITTSTALIPQVTELVKATAAFPQQLTALKLKPTELIDATKLVKADIQAVAATPDRITALIDTCQGIYADISTAFGK
jgi:hypothetical protein